MGKRLFVFLPLLMLIGTILFAVSTVNAVDFSLTVDTDPLSVLVADPTAVSGGGTYPSGTWVARA